ncbi:MAG: LPP20 family lipoprotein [Chloroherpetonaceae bacterium]|nr:LPP20 family lipoprotein [Chloroherpetonaceae bacterium]
MKRILQKTFSLLLTALVIHLSLSCASQTTALAPLQVVATAEAQVPPAWVSSGKDSRFPDDAYWLGVGSGRGGRALENARDQARNAIAKQLKMTVSSSTTLSEMSSSGTSGNFNITNLQERIQVVVDKMDLSLITQGDEFVSKVKGTTDVLMVLEKAAFMKKLRTELDEIVAGARTKISAAESNATSGNIASAVGQYIDALNAYEPFTPKQVFYNGIFPGNAYQAPQDASLAAIETGLGKLLSKVYLRKSAGDKQTGEVGRALEQPLRVKAVAVDAGKETPIRGVTVLFMNGEREVGSSVTDETGTASLIFLTTTEGTVSNRGKVTALIDFTELSNRLRQEAAKTTSVSFDYTAKVSPFTCDITVQGVGSDAAKVKLMKRMVAYFQKQGAVIKSGAPLVITATVTSTEAARVQSPNGELILQDVSALVSFANRASGEVVSSATVSAKGLDKSETVSVEKGMENLQFDSNAILEAILSAKGSR